MEIISGAELRDYPGHWKISGRTEEESEEWQVLRKPDGSYWEIVANHIFAPGTLRIYIRAQIVRKERVAQLEAYYVQIQSRAAATG